VDAIVSAALKAVKAEGAAGVITAATRAAPEREAAIRSVAQIAEVPASVINGAIAVAKQSGNETNTSAPPDTVPAMEKNRSPIVVIQPPSTGGVSRK